MTSREWPKYIGLTGKARAGKDTAAKLLSLHGYCQVAFADKVRECLYNLNPLVMSDTGDLEDLQSLLSSKHGYTWETIKGTQWGDHIRSLLQRMGTEAGRNTIGENVWIEAIDLDHPDNKYAVSDVRFPNEAEYLRSKGGAVIRIERSGSGLSTEHSSEAMEFEADYTVYNNGTMTELRNQLAEVLNHAAQTMFGR